MKTVYTKELVRKAHLRDGKSKSQIARELGINRRTVKRLLEMEPETIPRYASRQAVVAPVVGAYTAIIGDWLKEDEAAPRKQRHTVKRIYDRLVAEHGYVGSYSAIRDYLRRIRPPAQEVFLPLAFEPGAMAQVDWIEKVTVRWGGVLRRIYVFGMVLNYSGGFYFEAFERANQESFLQGHVNAFLFFGGVPRCLTYDNLKTAVTRVLLGKEREENGQFVAFRGAYLFDSLFCQPGKGNEKGRIENMVKFAERNLLTPVPCVESLSELNAVLRQRCLAYLQRTQERQTQTVGERLEAERPALLPLPNHPLAGCRVVSVKANKSSLVQFETNRYSVPSQYAYQTLWLHAYPERLEIACKEQVVTVHARLYGRYQERILAEHYHQVFQRKPGAVRHFKGKNKSDIPPKRQEAPETFAYPKVTVQEPNLAKYRLLLRGSDYDTTPDSVAGNASEEAAAAQHPQAVS